MRDRALQERLLVILLRLGGCITFSAFLAVIMPTDWMASAHRWLGLGDFPASPLVDYLTRSVAALYGFHGVLLLVVSTDPRRFRPIVLLIGIMNLLFGIMMLAIDLHAGLPMFWTLAEGPPIVLLGVVILVLVRSVPSAAERSRG